MRTKRITGGISHSSSLTEGPTRTNVKPYDPDTIGPRQAPPPPAPQKKLLFLTKVETQAAISVLEGKMSEIEEELEGVRSSRRMLHNDRDICRRFWPHLTDEWLDKREVMFRSKAGLLKTIIYKLNQRLA